MKNQTPIKPRVNVEEEKDPPAIVSPSMAFKEYCRRNPWAVECREYDL